MRHIEPPVKAVNVKFASKDLILYVISRPESWSVPQKRDACGLYARRQGEKTCIPLQRLDLFHGFAKGSVAKVALGDF